MEKLECPNCHQKTIPLWRKLLLGPATRTTCANCGSGVSVPYLSMLAAVPFLIAIVAAQAVGSTGIAAAALAIGVLVMLWIYYQFVPLIVKK
jgi:uncharacterized protein (DUF983 family)